MDPAPQTSFIPKKPLQTSSSLRRKPSTSSAFSILATVFFVLVLLSTGGVYIYASRLQGQNNDLLSQIDAAGKRLDDNAIHKLTELDNRINSVSEILQNHVAVSPIFSFIGRHTVQSVRFQSFDYKIVSNSQIAVQMKGTAKSFSTVALQSQEFNSALETSAKGNKLAFINPEMTDFSLDKDGNVLFTFTSSFDRAAFSYDRLIDSLGGIIATSTINTANTATTTLPKSNATGTPAQTKKAS